MTPSCLPVRDIPEPSQTSPTVSDSKMLIHFSRLRHASLSLKSLHTKMGSFPFVSSTSLLFLFLFFFLSTSVIKSFFVTPAISFQLHPHSENPLHPSFYWKPTDQQNSALSISESRSRPRGTSAYSPAKSLASTAVMKEPCENLPRLALITSLPLSSNSL